MKKLIPVTILLCMTLMITSFTLSIEVPEPGSGEIHYAKIVRYHQFGLMQTDTLCLNDSLWIRDGEHRKIPEFMKDSLWSFNAEPSLVKVRTESNYERGGHRK